ncbi:response regulator [Flavobacterium sp.]|uniref:response regulator n=1 Tax=Flavobacterium sp. TaxID=239 RepID=UPI002FDAEDD4
MKAIHVLLVEDNEGDILLTTEALEQGRIINKVSVAKDGKQAIDFLNRKEPFQDAEVPNLILLDINLPKKNGQEVLQYIKASKSFRHIPIIMLTTSSSKKDIIEAYNNHANCFITKPVDVNEFMQAVAKIEDFWISIVQLP